MQDVIRTWIVEDDPMWRESVVEALSGEPDIEVVRLFSTKQDVLDVLRGEGRGLLDVAVVDLFLGASWDDGLDLITVLNRETDARIVVVTAYPTESAVEETLGFNVHAFLPKEELFLLPEVVRDAAMGRRTVVSAVAEMMCSVFRRWKAERDGSLLTEEDKKILFLIWKGLSYHQIARALYLAKPTVRNRVHRLLKRLGFPSSRAAAEWAYRRGLFETMIFQEDVDR